MQDPIIKRALISVTDKTGVVEFARALVEEFGVEIVSTGGTAKVLEDGGVRVRPIDDLTGFPEMMDGRVKTLHPRVHGGLLARRDLQSHMTAAEEHGIGMIDMVVVNLYDFSAAVSSSNYSMADAIENIDIGGPSMLRSAAKNYASVTVVTNPASYEAVLAQMRAHGGATTLDDRQHLALEVFKLTSAYDDMIYAFFDWIENENLMKDGNVPRSPFIPKIESWSQELRLRLSKVDDLRYGENPHQQAAFYLDPSVGQGTPGCTLARAEKLQGKELSYNNYLDLDAAWAAVREFDEPTCVIVKHLTPCGIASCDDITEAYKRAHEVDSVSAYGGVMAFNRPVPASVVEAIYANGQFIEAVVAPSYDEAAVELFKQKPNARILETGGINPTGSGLDLRSVEGGMLVMVSDAVRVNPADLTVPSKRQPTATELDELLFAWKACKSVKSNAIVIASGKTTIGIGGGQPNRVNSARIAVEQAGVAARGAVAASDAFMPFADSLEVLVVAGVTAVIQPGGSVRDAEVLAAADAANVAVVFTGHRHFRH